MLCYLQYSASIPTNRLVHTWPTRFGMPSSFSLQNHERCHLPKNGFTSIRPASAHGLWNSPTLGFTHSVHNSNALAQANIWQPLVSCDPYKKTHLIWVPFCPFMISWQEPPCPLTSLENSYSSLCKLNIHVHSLTRSPLPSKWYTWTMTTLHIPIHIFCLI